MWFSRFRVLPGSAEAQVIWGGIVKRLLIAYFIGNIYASQKMSKSIHVRQSYGKPKVGRFWDTVYIVHLMLALGIRIIVLAMVICLTTQRLANVRCDWTWLNTILQWKTTVSQQISKLVKFMRKKC